MNVQGQVKIEQLQAAKLKVSNVNIQTHLDNGVLEFLPITAALYQGDIQSQAKINFTSAVPKISLDAKLTNLQAEPLLQDLSGDSSKLKLKGAATIDLQITTSGLATQAILKNLNGNGRFSFKNGVLEGIDLAYLVDSAYALVQKQAATTQNTNSTEFGDLNGSAVITNGVVNNNDLYLNSPRFETKGQGSIDLVNQQINYLLQTVSKDAAKNKGKNILNIYNLTIPIRVSGNLKNPSIELDSADLLKQVAKQQVEHVQDKLQEKVKEQLKDKIPGDAGALLQNLLSQ
jgi:AsmA protein